MYFLKIFYSLYPIGNGYGLSWRYKEAQNTLTFSPKSYDLWSVSILKNQSIKPIIILLLIPPLTPINMDFLLKSPPYFPYFTYLIQSTPPLILLFYHQLLFWLLLLFPPLLALKISIVIHHCCCDGKRGGGLSGNIFWLFPPSIIILIPIPPLAL